MVAVSLLIASFVRESLHAMMQGTRVSECLLIASSMVAGGARALRRVVGRDHTNARA